MLARVIFLLILLSNCLLISQGYIDTKVYQDDVIGIIPSKVTPTVPPTQDESSQDISVTVSEQAPPANIIRDIIKPKRDGGFYRGEVIEVLIKITVQKKGGLKQIEFWEMPDEDLKILRCAHQIRTSNIQQILDYEEHDDSFLQNSDIIDIANITSSLNNSFSDKIARHDLNVYMRKQLSNDTIILLNNVNDSKINESMKNYIRQNLSADFNRIINNSSTDLFNLFTKCNIKIDRKRVTSLNPSSDMYLDLKDYRHQKRQILEHIYPGMLRNLSISKKHEDQKLLKDRNAIKIIEDDIYGGEAIIFKYYLRPTGLGPKEIRYIIKADGYLQEDTETISVSERGEKFSITYWCDSLEVISDTNEKFSYSIEYLGGNDETHSFDTVITPPGGCKIISASWEDDSMPEFSENQDGNWSSIGADFSVKEMERINIIANFSETGSKISPPTIKIGSYPVYFIPELSVYDDYDSPFKIHYEFYSIILTIGAVLLSLIVAIFSSIEIYLANREIRLVHEEIKMANKQMELSKDDRSETNALIKRNIHVFEKLRRILK